ncbi:DEAD/DEAH box helicase family protein [Brucella sp. IR073]|uniref:DEAD/DEAH box helicase n=1 Tax=unclassified Brucella TaxID=2632610 RepID=UPI003B9824E8
MIELRYYQSEAIGAAMEYWRAGGGNPLVDLATGTGKSVVIAKMIQDLLSSYPDMRVLMLTHVKELVQQNFMALKKVWPDSPAGIYSAGLNRRDTHHRITFASIQSVFRKAAALGRRNLIVIDEAHLVPMKSEGMYRRLLDDLHAIQPDARVIGFTATPYRLDSGRLDEGQTRLFDKVVYTYGIGQGIEDGFLSALRSPATAIEIDVSRVERRGGEFVPASLETASDAITAEAVAEICRFGQERRAWLVFCSGVKHAINVRDAIRAAGFSCETVSGATPGAERDSIIRRFRNGEIRALTNANVLTTGFDVPHVDLVAMLRPTLSTSLYVQIVGRGTRLAHGKEDCLILDFAGNVRRHGPVDAVSVMPKSGDNSKGKVSVSDVRAKECPGCNELVAVNVFTCKFCGHEWPRDEKPKHEAHAEKEVGILSTEAVPPTMLPVVDWRLERYEKWGSPDSVRVTHFAGLNAYPEWVAFEHGGGATQRACQWWVLHRGKTPFPKTTDEALSRAGELTKPETVNVKPRPGTKFFDIVSRTFPARKMIEAAE